MDGAGAVYVAGTTTSADFPVTPGAYDTTCGSGTGRTQGADWILGCAAQEDLYGLLQEAPAAAEAVA